MHVVMGKSETSKSSRHTIKPYRKTVLGSSNLAIFLKPSTVDCIISTPTQQQQTQQQLLQNEEEKSKFDNISASHLYELLKEVNKVMVKGAKLYESLKELRLCGWVMPYTLILSGPSEDLKVVKQAWIKRHLKSPRGYFINDLGMVQDFVVELIPQSPFMSLTTALFDAVADLNHQNIFPTKNDIHEYLKRHYPEIKTPETKVIHECLGRLIKDRRLYHNGRGYFVLCNENILNDAIAIKTSETQDKVMQNTDGLLSPFIKGFKLSSSVTTSSSPGPTDLDMKGETISNNKVIDENSMDVSVTSTPNNMKKFFKRTSKVDKKVESKINKQKVFSCGIGGTLTDSVTILSNAPVSKNEVDLSRSVTVENKRVVDVTLSSENDLELNGNVNEHSDETIVSSERIKVKRSRSFGGKDTKKSHKEVSFALVGSPTNENEEPVENNYFKRSHSFGVGYSKKLHRIPTPLCSDTIPIQDNSTNFIDESMNVEDVSAYVDVENSFVDDSIPYETNHLKHHPVTDQLKHYPDMRPVDQKPLQALTIYQDLGSELSLHNKGGTLPLSVSELLSPPNAESLAQELKDAYSVTSFVQENNKIDMSLLSPRSRKKFGGIPYESHYVSEILEGEHEQVKDKNMNFVNPKKTKDKNKHNAHKSTPKQDDKHTTTSNGVKLRPRSLKSAEERKKTQKERNSLLFEEKRSSLKVMGMV